MVANHRFLFVSALLIVAACGLRSQTRILPTHIDMDDWGLDSPADIRFGILTLSYTGELPHLRVSSLFAKMPNELRKGIPHATADDDTPRRPPVNKTLSRATWVWNTDAVLRDTLKSQELLKLVATARFDRVFLQLPTRFVSDSSGLTALRSLVAALHRQGVAVEALTGDPDFSLEVHHPEVLRLIRKVIDVNTGSAADERFTGVHLDIEPYLLPGFGGPRKHRILRQFLTLLREAATTAHTGGLLLGTDIPFWYGSPDEFTGVVDSVAFDNARKPVHEFVIDLVDELCIMSYRTRAGGSNGIASLSKDELAYAEHAHKRVFVGFETSDVSDEDNVYFEGKPAVDTVTVGSANRFVVLSRRGDSAEVALLRRSELSSYLADNNRKDQQHFFWDVKKTTYIPSAGLSFARLGRKQLDAAIRLVEEDLAGYGSFCGVAIHHAASYGALAQ